MRLERRKVTPNSIIEIYSYNNPSTRELFFDHLKLMRSRGYKNLRDLDRSDDENFYATYEKVTTKQAK